MYMKLTSFPSFGSAQKVSSPKATTPTDKGEEAVLEDDADFYKCGPTFIDNSNKIDWSKDNDRRIVAASLVQAVYVMEYDNQAKRTRSPNASAPKWWQHFNFELVKSIQDKQNQSIVGAIFESRDQQRVAQDPNIPRYIIAFRGTILKYRTLVRDIKLNAQILLDRAITTSRGASAMEACEEFLVKTSDPNKIWLAGHSQGSTIALQVGRRIAENKGIFLETYLFNPPYPSASAPIGMVLRNKEKFMQQYHFCTNTFKAGVTVALKGYNETLKVNGNTDKLCHWRPRLYVNLEDPICAGYQEHFGYREHMDGINAGLIEKLANKYAALNLVTSPLGIKTEGTHLIPAAHLNFNVSAALESKESIIAACMRIGMRAYQAHQLRQWWGPEIKITSKTI